MSLDLAQIGFTTTVLESVASSIGAGMLISGFVMAAVGFLLGRSREEIEMRALRDACIGGIATIVLLIIDLMVRYFV